MEVCYRTVCSVKVSTEEFAKAKSRMEVSCGESANLLWSAHAANQSARKPGVDVNIALMAVSAEVTNLAKQKAAIIEYQPRDSLILLSTKIGIET